MIEGNERRPFYPIILQGNGIGNSQNSRVLYVNEARLNENFKIIDDELRRLWNKGIDFLSVRMTSDEQMFITAEDAEVIAVYQIENSALIAALPDTIMLQVQGVLTDYSTTVQMNSAIQQTAGSITSMVSQTYETKTDAAGKVGSNEIISKINQSAEQITIDANKVNLTGYITATNLSTAGQTTINGGNITTGTIDASTVTVSNINASNISSGTMSANKISGGTLTLGGQNNTNGTLLIKDANGNTVGTLNNNGADLKGSITSTVNSGKKAQIIGGGVSVSEANTPVLGSLSADNGGGVLYLNNDTNNAYVEITGDGYGLFENEYEFKTTINGATYPIETEVGGSTVFSISTTGDATITGDLTVGGTVSGQGFYDLLLGPGTAIPSNSDLNNYTTPGVWYAYLTQAQSASNCPVSTAFKLMVMQLFPIGRYYQILMASGAPDIYLRFYNDDTDTFTAWKKLGMTNV